jgi:hypothetical protein
LHRHTRGNAAKGPMAFHISSLLATLLFVALATEPLGYEVWSICTNMKLARKNSLEIMNNWHGKKADVNDSITSFLVYNKDFIDR